MTSRKEVREFVASFASVAFTDRNEFMIHSSVRFLLGLNGPVLATASLSLNATVVGGVSGPYGTRHLFQLGRHFDHYYDRRRSFPVWQTRGIYSSLPRVGVGVKSHSNDISGQIGECVGALIMRRIVGLSTSEIEPLVVDANRKTPDFRVFCSNAVDYLPPSLVTMLPTLPSEWPLESKSRPKEPNSEKGFHDALLQIATYWLLRGPQLPDVVGFGLICVAYDDLQKMDMHVIVPTQQSKIFDIINDFHTQQYTKTRVSAFQSKFKRGTYEVRNFLTNCLENT